MDSYTQFKVRVTTSSRREYVKEKKKGELEMAVREKPKEGKANEKVRELVASFCHVPIKNVYLIKGSRVSVKLIRVYEHKN